MKGKIPKEEDNWGWEGREKEEMGVMLVPGWVGVMSHCVGQVKRGTMNEEHDIW